MLCSKLILEICTSYIRCPHYIIVLISYFFCHYDKIFAIISLRVERTAVLSHSFSLRLVACRPMGKAEACWQKNMTEKGCLPTLEAERKGQKEKCQR